MTLALVSGCAGPSLGAEERAFLTDARPWGLILFKRNVVDRAQLRALAEVYASADAKEKFVKDFDGGGGIDGWNSAAEAFNVTLELVRRGYTEEQIGKLWSGNLLRVWGEVEKVAQNLRKN